MVTLEAGMHGHIETVSCRFTRRVLWCRCQVISWTNADIRMGGQPDRQLYCISGDPDRHSVKVNVCVCVNFCSCIVSMAIQYRSISQLEDNLNAFLFVLVNIA